MGAQRFESSSRPRTVRPHIDLDLISANHRRIAPDPTSAPQSLHGRATVRRWSAKGRAAPEPRDEGPRAHCAIASSTRILVGSTPIQRPLHGLAPALAHSPSVLPSSSPFSRCAQRLSSLSSSARLRSNFRNGRAPLVLGRSRWIRVRSRPLHHRSIRRSRALPATYDKVGFAPDTLRRLVRLERPPHHRTRKSPCCHFCFVFCAPSGISTPDFRYFDT